MPPTPTIRPSARSSRLGLRATPEQEVILRRAAQVKQQSLTDFILESACQAARETLLDQRLFCVPENRYRTLIDLLDRPAEDNVGLQRLFSKRAPWDEE